MRHLQNMLITVQSLCRKEFDSDANKWFTCECSVGFWLILVRFFVELTLNFKSCFQYMKFKHIRSPLCIEP